MADLGDIGAYRGLMTNSKGGRANVGLKLLSGGNLVTNGDGRAIPNSLVQVIERTGGGPGGDTYMSDSAGNWMIYDFPPGTYYVIDLQSYRAWVVQVAVDFSYTVTLQAVIQAASSAYVG